MSDKFNWSDPDLHVQRGYGDLAVYANQHGDIVIRQADAMGDDDGIVIVPRHLASWVIATIEDEMKKVHDDIQNGQILGEPPAQK